MSQKIKKNINHISSAKNPCHNPMQNITISNGLTKSWKSCPRQFCKPIDKSRRPQLVQITEKQHDRKSFGIKFPGVYFMDLYASVRCITDQFTNAIEFRDKYYALSLQGSLLVIEYVDSCFRNTSTGANRAVPDGFSRRFREYLVESDDEILLVFLVSRESVHVVDDVEVFRLDFRGLFWVKGRSIGDRTVFLEGECFVRLVRKKNCVYFTQYRVDDENWSVFDMKTRRISQASGSKKAHQSSD